MKPMRRVLALTLVLVAMLPVSYFAAKWQIARHEERDARNQLLQTARDMQPIPISSISGDTPQNYLRVSIEGVLSEEQALWRRQILNGIPGFTVLRNVIVDDGSRVTIALGWTQFADAQYLDEEVEFPILGYIRYPESVGTSPDDVPAGQLNFVSEIMQTTNYSFFVQSQRAPSGLSTLQLPSIEPGPHLGYVGQWILIGLASVVVYIIAIQRIRKDYASDIKSR